MSEVVFKYPIKLQHNTSVIMPKGAKILHLNTQGDEIFVWALVDTDAPGKGRRFEVHGTGHGITQTNDTRIYIGTVHMGAFVWHVFELVTNWA